jgi:nucleoside-diphosphate-sugar epimerase
MTTPPSRPAPSLAVVGADRPLGEAVLHEALGTPVLALAQDPGRVPRLTPSHRVPGPAPRDEAGYAEVLTDVRSVVLALEADGTTELAGEVTEVLRGARRAGVSRVVACSSAHLRGPASDPRPPSGLAATRAGALTRSRAQTQQLLDLRHCEMLLAGSGLDWTVVRTGPLTDLMGLGSQDVVAAGSAPAKEADRPVSREDLAAVLLAQARRAGGEPRVLTLRGEA